ncbi:MAG: CBS domain-containing protein [Chloroflexi bacterium]|nr:MAG: CBS domain-containing protein [Chloroflexota bacterium]
MEQAMTQQLWIYIDEGDSLEGRTVATRIVETLRAAGAPGVTVLRGVGGYGTHGVFHSDLLVDIPSRLPLVITCIDRSDRLRRLLPKLSELVQEGLIVLSPVQVVKVGRRAGGALPAHLTVADVMTHDVVSVTVDTPVGEVVSLLIERGLRAMPIIDADRKVVGIVTDADLLQRGVSQLPLHLQQLLPNDDRAAQLAAVASRPERVGEVMTPNPTTIPATASLAQAALVMTKNDHKRLPVVDNEGRLVGIISRSDLLQTVANNFAISSETLPAELVTATTVGEVMARDVPVVTPNTSLSETLDRILSTPRRRAVVIDQDRRVIGIVSDGDILRRAMRPVSPGLLQRFAMWIGGGTRSPELALALQNQTAANVMTSPVITVTPDTPITAAIEQMITHRIKRLPVVDDQGRLVGMVGRAALLGALIGSER